MKPKLKRDWVGRKVRSLHAMQNGYYVIPKGTVFVVVVNRGGLRLRTEPCKCCGVSCFISKVRESSVELLP